MQFSFVMEVHWTFFFSKGIFKQMRLVSINGNKFEQICKYVGDKHSGINTLQQNLRKSILIALLINECV